MKYPDEHHATITSVNQEQSYNPNSLTLQQPIHALSEVPFDFRHGSLEYAGSLNTKTHVLNVDIYVWIPLLGQANLAHASGNLANRVFVRFDKGGVVTGNVEFYERGGFATEMWAKSKFVLFGKEYNYDTPVMKIPEDLIAEIPLSQAQDIGSVHILEEQSFDTIVGYLKYTGTLNPETVVLSVNIHANIPILPEIPLGHAEGNLADGVTVQFDNSGLGARGSVEFYGRHDDWKELWARSRYTFFGKEYKSDFPVLRIQQDDISQISLQSQSSQGLVHIQGEVPFRRAKYTLAGQNWSSNEYVLGIGDRKEQEISILETKEFDYNAKPLLCTGTIDTDTLNLSIDVILIEGWALLGHGEGNIEQGVTVQFSEEGSAQGEVRFYLMNGLELWATWKYVLDGETYFRTGEVLNVDWLARVQKNRNKQHPISSLGITSFDAIVAPLQYIGTFDTETHTLRIGVDVLDIPDNIHLGTEEGPLRHSGGVLVEFDKPGVATGKVLFYERAGQVWAMARFTLYRKTYSSNVPLWEIPDN
jgi:hypothetical protein